MNNAVMPLERQVWLDVLRTFAIIGVLFVHTVSPLLGHTNNIWLESRLVLSIALTCVPIFFMVSGSLVLPKAHLQPLSRYLITKPIYLIILIITWEFLWRIFNKNLDNTSFTIEQTFTDLLRGNPSNSILWYLYKIAGAYMAAPFLAMMVSVCSTQRLIAFVAIGLGIDITFRTIYEFTGLTLWLPLDYRIYSLWLAYFVAGYLIAHRCNELYRQPRIWLIITFIGISLTASLALASRNLEWNNGAFFLGYDDIGIALASIGLFGFCSSIREKFLSIPFQKTLGYIGASTLGMYMIHMFVLKFIRINFGYEQNLFDSTVYAAIIGIISFAFTAIILRLPILRRLVSL